MNVRFSWYFSRIKFVIFSRQTHPYKYFFYRLFLKCSTSHCVLIDLFTHLRLFLICILNFSSSDPFFTWLFLSFSAVLVVEIVMFHETVVQSTLYSLLPHFCRFIALCFPTNCFPSLFFLQFLFSINYSLCSFVFLSHIFRDSCIVSFFLTLAFPLSLFFCSELSFL